MRFFSLPAIIEHVEEVQKYGLTLTHRPEPEIDWPMVQYALFHTSNQFRGPDGRTYNEIKDGKYISSFVSQYAPQIYENIEPGILPVVKALHDKGYLTYGSCQSHSLHERRWVGVVFHTREAREQFKAFVTRSHLPVHFYTDIFPWDRTEGTTLVHDFKPGYTKSDAVNYWNIMFGRVHSDYFPLLLLICGLPFDEPETWNPWRIIRDLFYTYVLKRFFVDFFTARLANFISKRATKFTG